MDKLVALEIPGSTRLWLNTVIADLRSRYTSPAVSGSHDYTHCERLVRWGGQIQGLMGLEHPLVFDPLEYEAACWLHNLDRVHDCEDFRKECKGLLAQSPFSEEAQDRIYDTVFQHSKKDDDPGDSDLLQALRIADKVDRFSVSGVLGAGQYAPHLLPYNPDAPFGYESTEEEHVNEADLYRLFFRPIEWYAMLPSDDARLLIPRRSLRYAIETVRLLAEEAAWHAGVPNRVEDDLREALGPYYEEVCRICR